MPVVIRLLAIVALAALGMGAGFVGVLLADRASPLVVNSVSLVPPPPTVGGMLKVEYDQAYSRECAVKVERTIYDSAGVRWVLPDLDFETTKTGRAVHISPVPVPAHAAEGEARYRVVLAYRCNPFQVMWPVVVRLDDFRFPIVASNDAGR